MKGVCLAQKSQSQKYFLSKTIDQVAGAVGLAVFGKFRGGSPRNVHISIKQPHLNKRQTSGGTPILCYAAYIKLYAFVAQKCSTWLFHLSQ